MLGFSNAPLALPDAEDFQRLGLRRSEYRPLVIRRALARVAGPLVAGQVGAPSREGADALGKCLTSGYRLIDPRRRDDALQRAVLGRWQCQLMEESVRPARPQPFGGGSDEAFGGVIPAARPMTADSNVAGPVPGDFGVGGPAVALGPQDIPDISGAPGTPGTHGGGVAPRTPLNAPQTAEGTVEERFVPLPGVAEEWTSWSECFLEPEDLESLRRALGWEDLLQQPATRGGFWGGRRDGLGASLGETLTGAIRRRLLATSLVVRLCVALLAASILLVMTWRTTVWWRRTSMGPDVFVSFDPRPAPPLAADGDEVDVELGMLGPSPLSPLSPLDPDPLGGDPLTLDSFVRDPLALGPLGISPADIDPLGRGILDDVMAPGVRPMDSVAAEPGRDVAEPRERLRWPAPAEIAAARMIVDREALAHSGRLGSAWEAYRQTAAEAERGSVEEWVAWLAAADAAIRAGADEEVAGIVSEFMAARELDRAEAIQVVADWAVREAAGDDVSQAVFRWLDRGMREAVLTGQWEMAGTLHEAMQGLGGRNRDSAIGQSVRDWRDVMTLAGRYRERFGDSEETAEVGMSATGADDRLTFGRYWALVRRDWDRAIPALSLGERGRLPRLAEIERALGDEMRLEEVVKLVDGYLLEAKRERGWLAESAVLHAHGLLTRGAEAASSETAKLELKRRAERLREAQPQAFSNATQGATFK